MPTNLDEIEAAEREWGGQVPNVEHEESPETPMAVKAHNCFVDKIMLASAIKKRRAELGLEGELTREKLDSVRSINGLCRKANGDIARIAKLLKEDALKWQRAVLTREKELKAEIAEIQAPMVAFIEKCEEEDEAAAQAEREAAEAVERAAREAERAAEQAKLDAQAEKNRLEAERLQAERKAWEIEQKKLNDELNARLEKEREEQRKKDAAAEVKRLAQEKIDAEIREFDRIEAKKVADELAELKRLKAEADAKEQAKIAAEAAEKQRIALEEAERFQAQQAAEKERLRREALEPDIPKIHRVAASINILITPHLIPVLDSEEAKATMSRAVSDLKRIAFDLLNFGTK